MTGSAAGFRVALDSPANLESVDVRKVDVEEDQIRRPFANCTRAPARRCRLFDQEPGARQKSCAGIAARVMIVDVKDSGVFIDPQITAYYLRSRTNDFTTFAKFRLRPRFADDCLARAKAPRVPLGRELKRRMHHYRNITSSGIVFELSQSLEIPRCPASTRSRTIRSTVDAPVQI